MTLNYLPFKTLDYECTAGTCGMELRPTPTPLFFSFLLTYLRVREGRICGAYLGTYSQNTRKISESVNVAEYLQI